MQDGLMMQWKELKIVHYLSRIGTVVRARSFQIMHSFCDRQVGQKNSIHRKAFGRERVLPTDRVCWAKSRRESLLPTDISLPTDSWMAIQDIADRTSLGTTMNISRSIFRWYCPRSFSDRLFDGAIFADRYSAGSAMYLSRRTIGWCCFLPTDSLLALA